MTQYNSPKNKSKNPYLAFLQSLDQYKHTPSPLDEKQCGHLKQIVQHYYETHYQSYYNNTIPYYSNIPVVSNIQNSEDEVMDSYMKWQQEHEVNPVLTNTDETTATMQKIRVYRGGNTKKSKSKEKVEIYTEIESLDNLLDLIKAHPYDCTKEYNIDLKALHKIKNEIEQLNSMVGLDSVKNSILRQLMYFMQGFTEDPNDSDYKHTILTGPPGTGKTEIAKLLGSMYSKIGILKNNVFKKVTRTDLVAGYLGQTAIKTQKVLDECSGGVLFLDEAYSLQYDDSYSKECVDTLCEALSDRKQNLMVIIAGYTNELEANFFRINSGLKSRFLWKFDIEPYDVNELYCIYKHIGETRKWALANEITVNWFDDKKPHFQDNGRSMEQLFSYSKIAHAQRIYGKDPQLRKTMTIVDMEKGFELYQEYGHSKKENNIYLGLYT